MSTAVFVFASLLGGAAMASPFAYIAGRRSSREELANAEQAVVTANASAARDDLAEVKVRPERTGEQPAVELYQQTDEETLPSTLLPLTSLDDVMAEAGITQEELDALPDDDSFPLVDALEDVGRTIGQFAAPAPDDTWQGTLGYLHSGEWAPAAPAPKRGGQ